MKLPGFIILADDELFDLLELVHSENTPHVLTSCSSLFSEARGKSTVLDGKVCSLQPFSSVHCRDGLLGCSNEVILTVLYRVKVLSEVIELASLVHELTLHEVGWLQESVASVGHKVQSVVDYSLVQKNSDSSEEIASVACNLGSSFWLKHVEASHDLVMMQSAH